MTLRCAALLVSTALLLGATVHGQGPVQVNLDALGRNILGDAANEPTLAVDSGAANRLVMAWRQFDDVDEEQRTAGWATSSDGGRSWTFHGAIEPARFRTDPVLAAGTAGSFLFYGARQGLDACDLFVSGDGGRSWSTARPAFGGDKPWMAVDASRGVVYAAWSDSIGCCEGRVFTRSFDWGESFMEPIEIDPMPTVGTIAVGPDGTVYIGGIVDIGTFAVARSDTAHDPSAAPTFEVSTLDLGGWFTFFEPPNPRGLAGQVTVAVDCSEGTSRGTVYVVSSVAPPGPDPLDVHLVRSTDGGRSWSEPVTVHGDGNDGWQWFGAMAVAPDGRLDVVWMESWEPDDPGASALASASSADGGVSWSPALVVSPVFDSLAGLPPDEKIGDYLHLVSDHTGAHVAFAATFNGEQDVYSLRLGPYDCNRNGVADPEDLAAGTSPDCDRNGIPDECELAAWAATDDDGNGNLDVCDARRPRRPTGRLAPLPGVPP